MPPPLDQILEVPDELHARVFVSQCVDIGRTWDNKDVYSSFWRLYVNNRGGAKALLPNGEFVLTPGRVHIIPAWVRFTCFNTRNIRHCYIHFDVLGLSANVVREVFDRPMTLPRGRQLDALQTRWVSDMLSPAAKSKNLAVMCTTKALIFTAVGLMIRNLSREQHAICSRYLYGQQSITPAIDHIENHLDQPLENETLAKLCHVSDDHFIRLFRKCIGQTPAQYVLDRRVSKAAQKLIFSTESVDSIAEQTGFCDRFYFTRVFGRRMGLSPAAYRKKDRI